MFLSSFHSIFLIIDTELPGTDEGFDGKFIHLSHLMVSISYWHALLMNLFDNSHYRRKLKW